jgi:GNAT superfamily N-acetyltransferase
VAPRRFYRVVITLRPAVMEDLPALTALIAASVRELSVGFYSEAQRESGLRCVFGIDTQLITDGTYFVCVDARGTLAASGGWSRRRTLYGGDQAKSGPDDLLDPAREPARIRAFFVHPDFARRGLGRRLFAHCRDAARAEGFTALELMATLPGVPLYTALGFTPVVHEDARLPDGVVLPMVRMRVAMHQP